MDVQTRKKLQLWAATHVQQRVVSQRPKTVVYKPTIPWEKKASRHEDFTADGYYYPVRCSSGFTVRRR